MYTTFRSSAPGINTPRNHSSWRYAPYDTPPGGYLYYCYFSDEMNCIVSSYNIFFNLIL